MNRLILAGQHLEVSAPRTGGFGRIEYVHPWIVFPSTTRSFEQQIAAAMDGLKLDIARVRSQMTGTAERAFLTSWDAFYTEWRTWYAQNSGFGARFIGATWDAAASFADRYNGFETSFANFGYTVSTPAPDSGQQGTTGNTWMWVGAGLIGLGLVAWGLSSVAKVAAPVARASERAA